MEEELNPRPEEGMGELTLPEEGQTPNTQTGAGDDPKDKIIADLRKQVATVSFQKDRYRKQLNEVVGPEERNYKPTVPSESELASQFPEWELMTDTERRLAKRQFQLEKEVSSQREVGKKITLSEQIEEVSLAPEFSAIGNKKLEFKRFCQSEENRGVPVSVLARAFLFEDAKKLGAEEEKQKSERKGLETATAGPRATPKPRGLSAEELRDLRENNPTAYQAYILGRPLKQ